MHLLYCVWIGGPFIIQAQKDKFVKVWAFNRQINSKTLITLRCFFQNTHKKMLRRTKKAALRTYISDRRFVIVPSFVPQSLLLFLKFAYMQYNMVYISPMHVVDTRPMFLRWCIVMQVWQLIRKCASLH